MLIQALIIAYMVSPGESVLTQPHLDAIGRNLQVNFTVEDNFEEFGNNFFRAAVTLTNTGNDDIPGGGWRIYFTSVQFVEPDFLRAGGSYVDSSTRVSFTHEKGYLFSFGPTPEFPGIKVGEDLRISFRVQYWSASRYEQMPNWYVAAPGLEAVVIDNTADESLAFVGRYTQPKQYKRFQNDQYQPWTPEMRFQRNQNNMDADQRKSYMSSGSIIPTPAVYETTGPSLTFGDMTFTLVADSGMAGNADYLTNSLAALKAKVSVTLGDKPPRKYIHLQIGDLSKHSHSPDAYTLEVRAEEQAVTVTGASVTGVFYGVISLLQLLKTNEEAGAMPGCLIVDWPRYQYRGMMVDTARNFRTKASILSLLDVMAMYKLNKFHFHLTDDEGWRLEIPGLPELTQVGGKRCHDTNETKCVMSTLGSGPDDTTSGSGFYTVEEYKEILTHAAARHIEVIPEIDMPGHAHSAVRAMRARNLNLKNSGKSAEEAGEYDLDEEGDASQYLSVQFYRENAVNPCMNSSYRFIEKVFSELQKMHEGIQPLKVYHFGGDEVAKGAWLNSSACADLLSNGADLKKEFTRRVSDITRNISLAGWEDGLLDKDHAAPWQRDSLHNNDVIGYAWQNVWEWGGAARAYNLANAGYKVVLAAATEFYFDQPQEPSPDERGFYWATRYTDTHKTFKFMPDHYFMNAEVKRSGEPITLAEICGEGNKGCPTLNKTENIIGIQGHLWSETVRRPEHLDYMVFPRLLALAERAWHQAAWEGQSDRQNSLRQDWTRFSSLLGEHHLGLLDLLGVKYRVPPPGARQQGDKVMANAEFPGLPIQYKILDVGSSHWHDATVEAVEDGQRVAVRTSNPSKTRFSQEVVVTVNLAEDNVNSAGMRTLPGGVCFALVTLMFTVFY